VELEEVRRREKRRRRPSHEQPWHTTSSPSEKGSLSREVTAARICVAALRIEPRRRPRGGRPRTDRGPAAGRGGRRLRIR
jgi:hypothetical protein